MKWYFIALKNYALLDGRARRSEYFHFTLISLTILITLSFIDVLLETVLLQNIFGLFALIPTITVSVRRMHDVNKSGWFLLIPVYNLILILSNGSEGLNDYGFDPKKDQILEEIELIGNN